MKSRVPRWASATSALLILALLMGTFSIAQAQTKMKVGFIYTGLISDHGWTSDQDTGRRALEKALPWVETSYVESVTEGDVESYIDQMADQGVKVIFTTSPTFMDGTIEAASRHPDIIFFNADGYKEAANVGTFIADDYQCCYLMGLASAALSKSGKVGTVESYPTPENVCNTDAFVLGLKVVNPKAILNVRWLNSWDNPPEEKEATETLLGQGFDVLFNGMDSSTVEQVAEIHHVPISGQAVDGPRVAPNSFLTGGVSVWGPAYVNLLKKIQAGVITPHNLQDFHEWWRLSSQAVQMYYTPGSMINPKYKEALARVQTSDGAGHSITVYDLILKRFAQMSADPPQFEPFTGPLVDADGKIQVAPGQIASKAQLFSMTWRLPGITGSWPK